MSVFLRIVQYCYCNRCCCCGSERHDAIFVVGALDETIMLRGMRYHPIDIENSIVRCHRKITEWSVAILYFVASFFKLTFVKMYFLFDQNLPKTSTHNHPNLLDWDDLVTWREKMRKTGYQLAEI